MITTIPINMKCCVTCRYWGGQRRPSNVTITNVEYDTYAKGTCYGGGFNQQQMACSATCNKWEPQYKKN